MKKVVQVKMPEALHVRLALAAARRAVSVQRLVRDILGDWLAYEHQIEQGETMIKYAEADATRNGLFLAGWPGPIGLSVLRGNSGNADGIKCDFDRPDDNMPAETFTPDESYPDYSLHVPTGPGGTDVAGKNRVQLSVLRLRATWGSRGDFLNDLKTTAAECPLPNGATWIDVVLSWPEVRAAVEAKMATIRGKMQV